jgi:hypothetical protein
VGKFEHSSTLRIIWHIERDKELVESMIDPPVQTSRNQDVEISPALAIEIDAIEAWLSRGTTASTWLTKKKKR